MSRIFLFAALCFFVYSLVWEFSTQRYLRGFADAIVPLTGSPQEKTEALVEWFHHEPLRITSPDAGSTGLMESRDPVNIVQQARLLRVCGTSTNAFLNLARAAGLKTRRLLLVDRAGDVFHVVAEVQWGNRWVVVNPQQGLIFEDSAGRGLSKEELRDPQVFRDAISRMPGYDPSYTFAHTIHIRLKRIPLMGAFLRRGLDRYAPGWEEATNWGYFPERPPLVLLAISSALLLLAALFYGVLRRRAGKPRRAQILQYR